MNRRGSNKLKIKKNNNNYSMSIKLENPLIFDFRIQEPFALFDELYDKPWLRAGPFFVGTITGYLLYKSNGVLRISSVSNSTISTMISKKSLMKY